MTKSILRAIQRQEGSTRCVGVSYIGSVPRRVSEGRRHEGREEGVARHLACGTLRRVNAYSIPGPTQKALSQSALSGEAFVELGMLGT